MPCGEIRDEILPAIPGVNDVVAITHTTDVASHGRARRRNSDPDDRHISTHPNPGGTPLE